MNKKVLLIASLIGGFSVLIGAVGAHFLESHLIRLNRVETFDIAVRYQFYHVFLLFVIAIIYDSVSEKKIFYSLFFCLTGVFLFSGSLYLLSLTNNTFFAGITPFGGASLILSWLFLFFSIRR